MQMVSDTLKRKIDYLSKAKIGLGLDMDTNIVNEKVPLYGNT